MATEPVHWYPEKLIRDDGTEAPFSLLVLNQPLKNSATLRRLWKNAALRVAADGGANRLHTLSTFHGKFSNLNAIVGDLDSLSANVRDFYSSQPSPAVVVHLVDQESTDFNKAVKWIREEYPSGMDVVALGGLGGRVDQGIRQLHEIYLLQEDPTYASGRLYLLSGSSLTFLLKAGKHQIHVHEDGEARVFAKHIGIIPLVEPSRITTKGLQWDVTDWDTRMSGPLSTSNHILPDTTCVEVETTKDVLFTVALLEAEEDDK